MRTLFADSGYWIALWNPEDALHDRATTLAEALRSSAVVTTRLVLIETLNFMAGMGLARRRYAVRMAQDLEDNPDVEIVPLSDAQFRAALERYAARPDQRWSVTDCASFLVMEERGMTDALAHDRDFEQAGFASLLRTDHQR